MNLLQTKLYLPQVRHSVVRRERLIARLDTAVQGALTLLSAPAGFGKTTLLAEWASRSSIPVAWISLDEGDNDPARFYAYLIAALDKISIPTGPETRRLADLPQPLPSQALVTPLLADLDSWTKPFAVVLDDYHAIQSLIIHEMLAYLLDHLPPSMHLVLATRADPPLSLARLRARSDLTELRAADLRFTLEESASFLNQVMELDLTPADLDSLETRTEGWIAGLQMAALSMQGRADLSSFIRTFSGSHRFILDYLAEEVIQRQPETVQTFLLKTSILDRLCGSLCDAITESRESREESSDHSLLSTLDSQFILEYLDRSNIFLVPLDDERRWYRYHHLFGELLKARLEQTDPGSLPGLQIRASIWLEEHELITEAIQYALFAGDTERAAGLIERHGQKRWAFSDLTFMTLIGKLPYDMVESRPRLGVYYAWSLILYGQIPAAEALLHSLDNCLDDQVSDPELQGLRSFISLLLAYSAEMLGRPSAAPLPDPRLLGFVPERLLGMRNSADVLYALLLIWRGELEPAVQFLWGAVQRDITAQGTTAIPIAISALANIRIQQGRLREAAGLCRDYLQKVNERGKSLFYTAGNLDIALAEILREWNDLEAAELHTREGLKANRLWNTPLALSSGYVTLARVQIARGDLKGAVETGHAVESSLKGRTTMPNVASAASVLKVRLWLALDDYKQAGEWAESFQPAENYEYRFEMEQLARARVFLALGLPEKTQRILGVLSIQTEAGGRLGRRIEVAVLEAIAWSALGDPLQAHQALEIALRLGRLQGYRRIFLDEGDAMKSLLKDYRSRFQIGASTSPDQQLLASYAGEILEAFPPVEPVRPVLPPHPAQGEDLIEPLTSRELEVLRLVCAGDSNREIAAKLVITVAAVKKHTGNIYGKLGVSSRTQAIARAKLLKLISDPS